MDTPSPWIIHAQSQSVAHSQLSKLFKAHAQAVDSVPLPPALNTILIRFPLVYAFNRYIFFPPSRRTNSLSPGAVVVDFFTEDQSFRNRKVSKEMLQQEGGKKKGREDLCTGKAKPSPHLLVNCTVPGGLHLHRA